MAEADSFENPSGEALVHEQEIDNQSQVLSAGATEASASHTDTEQDRHGASARRKGKQKATEPMQYYGRSRSELKKFIDHCESTCAFESDGSKIDFAAQLLKGTPAIEWLRYQKEHIEDNWTWQDLITILEGALQAFSKEVSSIQTNESLTSFHRAGSLSYSASIAKPAQQYDLLDVLAIVQHWRVDILPFRWEPELDIGLGGTAKISQGGNVGTSHMHQLSFVFKRVHRETSSSENENNEYQALLSEILVLGHPVVRQHPNIVNLEGICWDIVYGEAWPVLVFQRTEHGDLKQFMKTDIGRRLEFSERVKLCREIGNAILLMHSCCVVHGDVKPDNILIFKDAEGSYSAKVADFGYSTLFAKEVGRDEVQLPRSWPWAAPEIEECASVTLEQAISADIFSYGMICFWLLCHETLPRKQNEDDGGPDLDALWKLKIQKQLSSAACAEIGRKIADIGLEQMISLHWFFDLCLSNDRDGRKLNIDSLTRPFDSPRVDLPLVEEFGKSATLISKPAFNLIGMFSQFRASSRPTWETIFNCLEKRAKDHADTAVRKVAAFQLAFCYKVGFGVAVDNEQSEYWLENSNRQRQDLDDAVAMVRADAGALYRDIIAKTDYFDGARPKGKQKQNFQTDSNNDPTDSNSDEITPALAATDMFVMASTAAWIHSKLGINPGEVRMVLVPAAEGESDDEPDADLAQLCKEQFGWADGGGMTTNISLVLDREDLFSTFPLEMPSEVAEISTNLRTPADEEEIHTQSMEKKLKILGPDHPNMLPDMEVLSRLYIRQERWEEAEGFVVQMMNIQIRIFGQEHPATLKSMLKLAGIYMMKQRWKEAEALVLQVMNVRKNVLGVKHADTLKCLEYLDYLVCQYQKRDMLKDIEALIEQAAEIRRKAFGTEHEKTLETMQLLGQLYVMNGHKFEEAENLLTQVVKGREKLLGVGNKETLESMQLLAALSTMQLGTNPEKAGEAHRLQVQILNTRVKLLKTEHPKLPTRSDELESPEHCCEHSKNRSSLVNSMGDIIWGYLEEHLDRGETDEAIRKAEEVLENLDDGNPDRARVLGTLASALVGRFRQTNDPDDLDAAVVWAEQAVLVLPDDHLDRALRLSDLSYNLWTRFEVTEASRDLDDAIQNAEEAVAVTVDGDEKLPERISSLANRLRGRFDHQKNIEDLEMAIIWAEQVVEVLSADDPRRAWWLILLNSWLKDKYKLSTSVDDLNEAIRAGDNAEEVIFEDATKVQLLDELSKLYEERFFEHSHDPEDLHKCIWRAEQAVDIAATLEPGADGPTISGDAPYGPLLYCLALKYYFRFELVGDLEDLEKAVTSIDRAVEVVPTESRNREGFMRARGVIHGRQHMVCRGRAE